MIDVIRVPDLFLKEKNEGGTSLAVPKFHPESDWLTRTKGKVSVTFMLDGQCVYVSIDNGKKNMYRRVRTLDTTGKVVFTWVLCMRADPLDKPLWDGFDDEKPYCGGVYEVIGPGIKGNPHNIPKVKMIRVLPAAYNIVARPLDHDIRITVDTTPEALYEKIKKELSDPLCDLEGLVFHEELWEQGVCDVVRACKVRKKDMGIPWPKVKEVSTAEVPIGTYGHHGWQGW